MFRSVLVWAFALFYYTKRALSYELSKFVAYKNLKRTVKGFLLCFLSKIKLSYLFVVVGLNKVFLITEPRGKCQDNSRVFYVTVQKRNKQARQTETLNYWRLLLAFLTGISLVKIASISRPFLGNERALLPEKTTGSVDLLLSTSTNQIIACRNRVGNINYFSWSRFHNGRD